MQLKTTLVAYRKMDKNVEQTLKDVNLVSVRKVTIFYFDFYSDSWVIGTNKRPSPAEFNNYVHWYLSQTINSQCSIDGTSHASDVIFSSSKPQAVISTRFELHHSGK